MSKVTEKVINFDTEKVYNFFYINMFENIKTFIYYGILHYNFNKIISLAYSNQLISIV